MAAASRFRRGPEQGAGVQKKPNNLGTLGRQADQAGELASAVADVGGANALRHIGGFVRS